MIEVSDAFDFFVALFILRGLHRRLLAAQLTDDRAVVRSVLKRVVLSLDLVELFLIAVDLGAEDGIDPHRFRCEQEEAHRRQED